MKEEEKKIKSTRPFVCICDFKIVVTPKKWLNRINSGNPKIKRETIKKYVYSFYLKDYPITLSKESNFKDFPTEKTRDRVLESVWLNTNQKGKYDSVVLEIKDINIKYKSKVGYEFDYSKD